MTLRLDPPYTRECRFPLYTSETLKIEGSVYKDDDRLFLHISMPDGKFRYKEFIEAGSLVRGAADHLGIEWLCTFAPSRQILRLSQLCGFQLMVTYVDEDTDDQWYFLAQPSHGV